MKEKKCKRCGDLFLAKGKQVYCGKEKIAVCPACGKEFSYICGPTVNLTCSSQCAIEYSKQQRAAALVGSVKRCKWCGEEFTPKTAQEVYCHRVHYQTCVICGQQFEIDVRKDRTIQTCSPKCKKKLQSQNHDYVKGAETQRVSLLATYGVDNAAKIPGSSDRAKATNLVRYGAPSYTATAEYRHKLKQTCMERYGVEHHLKSSEVIAKREQTNLARYGVKNVSQAADVQHTIRDRVKSKYGVEYISQAHIPNMAAWLAFKSDPDSYIQRTYPEPPTYTQLALDLGVSWPGVHDVISKANCQHLIKYSQSTLEEELVNVIRDIVPDIRVDLHVRKLIYPHELDIYLPDYRIAFECDPTITHNSSVCDPWGGQPKSYKYHQDKTTACESVGITLFHLFSYDWKHKHDIIVSMIRNLLGESNRLYARKCTLQEISYEECAMFLNINHRQGNTPATIRLGLYSNAELVSVMTLGHLRKTVSGDSESANDWELLRFCSKLNTTVIGGASKLFKYFVQKYNPDIVVSFSDRARTRGLLYPQLGFTPMTKSNPGYVWVATATDIAYNRVNAQKHNLKHFLHDDTIDLAKTEKQIMEEHGFVQVFDSGTIRWEWTQ